MPIPVTTPPAVNFPGPYIGNPCRLGTGRGDVGREIAFSINWSKQGGPNNCVSIDLRQNVVNPITELRTLYVDNLSNIHPSVVTMGDTNHRIVCPPLSAEFYPVITNGLQFSVYNVGVTSGDTTNILALNSEINYPTQVNENLPNAAYNQFFELQNGSGIGSAVMLQQKGQQQGSNILTQALGSVTLFTNADPNAFYVCTGFDVFCSSLSNSLGVDGVAELSLSWVGPTTNVIDMWDGEIAFPRNTFNSGLMFNFPIVSVRDLQIPLFALALTSSQTFTINLIGTIKPSVTYRVIGNVYVARVQ